MRRAEDRLEQNTTGRRIGIWVLTGLLGLVYAGAGLSKLIAAQDSAQHFAQWGYPAWFSILIGVVELAGAIGLLIPAVAFYAAGALGVVMVGAVYTLLRAGDANLPVPAVCLGLLAALAYLRRPRA